MSAATKQGYHHGALRKALIDVAADVAATEGREKLSLRKLAKRVGVTHAAVYRHFKNKDALLSAVAEEGFDALDDEMEAALAKTKGLSAKARFRALGVAYVRFAIRQPTLFHLMFRRETVVGEDGGLTLPIQAKRPFMRVGLQVGAMLSESGSDRDPKLTTLALWSAMHGFATLWIQGPMVVQSGERDAEPLAERISELLEAVVG
ncbi:MAG: TetR/AcrR family transcriptional regulator [Myxococcota bacterium]|nr:TetR/AcrR family transcriptional regulator [Myxococcota bacterium]